MYAVIRSGNKQYRVEEGGILDVERLPYAEGDSFEVNEVLLVGNGDKTVIGQPKVDGASVKMTVVSQYRGEKIIVFKYRQRTTFRRKRGHRQYYTRVRVDAIQA
jgi:large subunit ribosomal protein L21